MRRSINGAGKVSAALLAFRRGKMLDVLLAHPGGPFWAKKDDGAWTIPKGLVEPGADFLSTATREFAEETNLVAAGRAVASLVAASLVVASPVPASLVAASDFMALSPVTQKGGKVVHAFAFESDFDLSGFASNGFEIEWPPKSGKRQRLPEIDRIAYFPLPLARTKILAYQLPLLDELERRLQSLS